MTRHPDTISFWRGVLPHWEVVGGRYFVTLRLANSLPLTVLKDIHAILADVSDKNYLQNTRTYFKKMDHWLDKNTGDTWLQQEEIAQVLWSTVEKYIELGYWRMMSAVIMPNHVHMFFQCGDQPLGVVMRNFKRYTGRAGNALLGRRGKRFWQREWFDHWSRSVQEDEKIVSYIRNNPVRAGLVQCAEDWPWVM